jgi:hypothetical protein
LVLFRRTFLGGITSSIMFPCIWWKSRYFFVSKVSPIYGPNKLYFRFQYKYTPNRAKHASFWGRNFSQIRVAQVLNLLSLFLTVIFYKVKVEKPISDSSVYQTAALNHLIGDLSHFYKLEKETGQFDPLGHILKSPIRALILTKWLPLRARIYRLGGNQTERPTGTCSVWRKSVSSAALCRDEWAPTASDGLNNFWASCNVNRILSLASRRADQQAALINAEIIGTCHQSTRAPLLSLRRGAANSPWPIEQFQGWQ